MQGKLIGTMLVLGLVAFAGCTGEPEPRPVDFSGVDQSQPGANFQLMVKVVGVGNETTPIPGAFVGAANGAEAVAKDETDQHGDALLEVRKGQTIRIVAKADGWTTEDSGDIAIGKGDEANSSKCGSFRISVMGRTETQQSWCVVTASNNSADTRLDGSQGAVSIVLFPKTMEQSFKVRVEPHANAVVAVVPDGKSWFPQTQRLHDDPDLHQLHILRLTQTTTSMKWRNNLLEQGDFELGVGCQRETPAARTSNTVPYLGQQTSPLTVTKDWNPKSKDSWAQCPSFFAGPIVDTVNSPITVDVNVNLVFTGKSLIIPVGQQ